MSYILTDVLLAIVGILASILIVLTIVGVGKEQFIINTLRRAMQHFVSIA